MPAQKTLRSTSCWTAALSINLALPNDQMRVAERCTLRYTALSEAQSVCESKSWCGGVSRDGGIMCGRLAKYEIRTNREISAGRMTDASSWLKLPRGPDGTCNLKALEAYKSKLFRGSRRVGGGSRQPPPPAIDTAALLGMRLRRPGTRIHSRAHCVGPCCKQPLARNRTCAFQNLLFTPPSTFRFIAAGAEHHATASPSADHATFLHNRFIGGDTTGSSSHSFFNPVDAPASAAINVTRVVETPLYIGADLHSNIAHLMLDSVYPFIISLLRLHATAADNHLAPISGLPDAVSGNFTFLLYDSPNYVNWHRSKKERTWTETVAGVGVVDLPQLAAACPTGCFIRTAWVGAGHVGLCAVDEKNFMGGAREYRSLFRFRQRIFRAFGVPHAPLPSPASAKPTVLVVRTKRVVTNLEALIAAINSEGRAMAKEIRWETMSFVQQLRVMRTAAVQVSGIGSAQINQFLLPKGSVAVCLGWRDEKSPHGIHYFDSHILRSMDHVRAVYYPSYSLAERRGSRESVTLDVPKAVGVVRQALQIYADGFAVPLPPDANANKYDKAFEALVAATDGEALRARTDDYLWEKGPYAPRCSTMNGVEKMIWGLRDGPTTHCPWYGPVPRIARQFDL